MSRDDPPHDVPFEDPEESLRRLLQESASANDSEVPRARHKRYAKRAMRRRKESAHLLEAQSGRRDDTPLTPVQTHITSKVQAIPPAPESALDSKGDDRDLEIERLRAERRRLQELVHKLRKDAADAKRELRFTKAKLNSLSEREQVMSRENQRLQMALLRGEPPESFLRQRRYSGVEARDEADALDDDDRTGTE